MSPGVAVRTIGPHDGGIFVDLIELIDLIDPIDPVDPVESVLIDQIGADPF